MFKALAMNKSLKFIALNKFEILIWFYLYHISNAYLNIFFHVVKLHINMYVRIHILIHVIVFYASEFIQDYVRHDLFLLFKLEHIKLVDGVQ
jgi:hypothetical protein